MAALAKQASMWPNRSTVSATAPSTAASSETSQRSASTPVPCSSSAFSAARFLSALVPQMATSAPWPARAWAMARPIPLLPPVTSATLPSSENRFRVGTRRTLSSANTGAPAGDPMATLEIDAQDLDTRLEALGLTERLGELERHGYTVVPGVVPLDVVTALRERILACAAE